MQFKYYFRNKSKEKIQIKISSDKLNFSLQIIVVTTLLKRLVIQKFRLYYYFALLMKL